jgi:hypothetical protein
MLIKFDGYLYSCSKHLSDQEESLLAWVLSRSSQYCRTAVMAMVLTCILVSCDDSQSVGWHNPYCRHRVLSLQNHDVEEVLLLENTWRA